MFQRYQHCTRIALDPRKPAAPRPHSARSVLASADRPKLSAVPRRRQRWRGLERQPRGIRLPIPGLQEQDGLPTEMPAAVSRPSILACCLALCNRLPLPSPPAFFLSFFFLFPPYKITLPFHSIPFCCLVRLVRVTDCFIFLSALSSVLQETRKTAHEAQQV